MINSVIHHLGIGLRDPKSAESFLDRLFARDTLLHLPAIAWRIPGRAATLGVLRPFAGRGRSIFSVGSWA